ncbi:hypothetical protein OSG_eHP32_00105 [environmental Halophage eHP-32]|nr:hypothetical protein OSG_eHP32_00105 [environmental Halophage eHP-32]
MVVKTNIVTAHMATVSRASIAMRAFEAEVEIRLPEADYHRLRDRFNHAVKNGYPDTWVTFVFNHTTHDYTVTPT